MKFSHSLQKAFCTFVLSAVTLVVSTTQSSAQKLNWGGAANDINVDSSNVGLDDATFTFQLGTFTNGDDPLTEFIPNTANTDFWGERWVALDTAIYNQEDPPSENEGFFADSWTVTDNTYAGFQAYIWVYNNQIGDATSEWVLITNDLGGSEWKIPAHFPSQTNFPDQWRVSSASTAIYGGLNNVDGPGERSEDPGTFALQTNTFLPIPEPGGGSLLALSLGLLLLRRRRL